MFYPLPILCDGQKYLHTKFLSLSPSRSNLSHRTFSKAFSIPDRSIKKARTFLPGLYISLQVIIWSLFHESELNPIHIFPGDLRQPGGDARLG